jgi:hypothetical protein
MGDKNIILLRNLGLFVSMLSVATSIFSWQVLEFFKGEIINWKISLLLQIIVAGGIGMLAHRFDYNQSKLKTPNVQLEQKNQCAEMMSYHDGLIALYNRRGFFKFFSSGQRLYKSSSILLMLVIKVPVFNVMNKYM